MGQLNKLKEKLSKKHNKINENDLPRIHHVLMKEYGWISLEEFKKIPLPTLWSLLSEIGKDCEAEEKKYNKIKK